MQKLGEQLVLSAHDLITVMECEHKNLLNYLSLNRIIDKPEKQEDENLKLIQDLGLDFEKKTLQKLKNKNYRIMELPEVNLNGDKHKNYLTAWLETLKAIKEEPDYIYQGVLYTGDFLGYVDFLQIVKDGNGKVIRDENNIAVYEPVDTKLARTAKKSAVTQVGIYAEVMTRLGLPKPENVHLWLASESKISYRSDDIIPLAKQLFERIENLKSLPLELPKPVWAEKKTACDLCIWKDHCANGRIIDNDISLVYETRVETRKKLREAGVNTIEKLANLDISQKPLGISNKTFEKIKLQAKIQFEHPTSKEEVPFFEIYSLTELKSLPPRDIGDVWFDMEGDPHACGGKGLEYLFGLITFDEGDSKFIYFGAENEIEEKKAFERFIDWIVERLKIYPNFHIYHYANYENSTLKRLSMNYQTRQKELDQLLRLGIFIDLFNVVRKTFRFSTDSLSLKTIEKVYGQSHGGGDVKTAADSIVQYERVIKERMNGNFAEAERILKNIYDYNELDCLSTKQLDDWLREEAKKQNIEFVIKNIKSDSEDSDDENENIHPIEEKINLLKLYLEGAKDKKWSDEDIRGLEILLGSINFHYQEKLPAWWQHFERVKAEPEELINDDSVVYIEKAESGDWSKEGRQRNYRRFTRVISNGYGLSDVFSPGDEVHSLYDSPIPAQCLTLIDSERGYEKAKIIANDFGWGIEETTKSGSEGWPQTPVAVLPGPPIDTKNLTKALIELADLTIQRLEQGLTPFENQNWSDLARRMKPRTLGNKPLPREGNDIKDVIRAIEISDNSYVAVQGPPGSGKTFLGTRVIAELIKLGYKIGIVAQSHAVIENFLDKLYELDSSLPIAKKQHNENIQNKPWHTQKIEVFANLQNAGYVIGGTTWNFSRDVIKELNLDLMVIEEAGQFALANTLIVASRAKKTLLLGDPQQLEQVSQASHMYPVDKSALGHILDKHKTIPDDWGYFLSKTYRMHSKLTKPVSILQYENRLVSASVTDERELEEVDPGLKKLTLNHSGNTTRSEEEVEKIIKLIQQLVGKNWTENNSTRKLRQEDILIVAPYNNQVRSIKQALVKNELKKVRVGTVDKFQGQEAPVSILSMTTSSGEDLPRGIEFLLQANRLNVGISRAMWASFIIYSKELLNINPTTADAAQRLGAFIGLIQNAQEWEQ